MSYLAFEPERLAAMYTSLQKLGDQLQVVVHRLNYSLLYLPEVHGQLHYCRSLIESEQIIVGNVLKSDLNFSHMVPSPVAMGIRCRLDDWLKHNPGWWAEATHPQATRIDELLRPVANDPHVAGKLIDDTSFLAPQLICERYCRRPRPPPYSSPMILLRPELLLTQSPTFNNLTTHRLMQ